MARRELFNLTANDALYQRSLDFLRDADHNFAEVYDALAGVSPITRLVFEPSEDTGHETGKLYYDADEDCLVFYNSNANSKLELSRELRLDVRNNTAVTINDFTVVAMSGSTGNKFNIVPADKDSLTLSQSGVGVTTYAMPANSDGEVITFGKVNGIDATGAPYGETWAANDVLYMGNAGAPTNIRPTSGEIVVIGSVLRAHAVLGTVFIRVFKPTQITHGGFDAAWATIINKSPSCKAVYDKISAMLPTVQAADPLASEMVEGQWVLATGSGDMFYKSAAGLFTFAGAYTPDTP